MTLALALARLCLAAVFVLAGLSKLADREGSREAATGFGVPQRLVPAFAVLLPIAELALGVALLWPALSGWGALGALALLAAFVAAIARVLARGEQPDCHCFGQLHSEPVGASTIARNVALAALAVFVLAEDGLGGGGSVVAWIGDLSATGALALACAAGFVTLGWMHLSLLRQHGRILLRLDELEAGHAAPPAPAPAKGLPAGAEAPAFSLAGVHGDTQTLASLRSHGKPALLLFTDPQCGPCGALLPEVASWQQSDDITVALLSGGSEQDNLAKASEHGLHTVLLDQDRALWPAYRVNGTPSAVAVGPDGRVLAPLAEGADEIRGLVARVRGDTGTSAPLAVVQVPARPAEPVERALRGHMLLFWDPTCGFCAAMLDDLRRALATFDGPPLAIVSKRALPADGEIPADVVRLDETFALGQRLGVAGTPSALLVDDDGLPVTPPATGADEVLALLATTAVAR